MTLDQLQIHDHGEITAVNGEGAIRSRLMDFGLVPGTRVCMLRRAPGGGPFEIRVRGTLVSLRPAEAKMIEVVPVGFCGRRGRGHGKGGKHRGFWRWFRKSTDDDE